MGHRRRIKFLMWALAVLYPVGVLTTVVVRMHADPFSIFDRYYLLVTVLVLPPLLILVSLWLGTRRGAPGWGWTLVLALWIACVGFLHYTFAAGGV